MRKYKQLFIDVDGTTMNHNQEIHPLTIEAIKTVQQNGIDVWLATGRPSHELKELMDEIGVTQIIGYNGACATRNNEVIYEENLNEKTITHFIKTAQKHNHGIVLYKRDKNLFPNFSHPLTRRFIDYFNLKENAPFDERYLSNILGVTIMGAKEPEIDQYNLTDDLFFSTVNIKGFEHHYDVIQPTINKGTAIKAILKERGYMREEAIAFGDGQNDRQMFEEVGTSFMMSNGHADLKAYATHQAKSVDEAGIYYGLKELGLI